jgi:hypothetical protein
MSTLSTLKLYHNRAIRPSGARMQGIRRQRRHVDTATLKRDFIYIFLCFYVFLHVLAFMCVYVSTCLR